MGHTYIVKNQRFVVTNDETGPATLGLKRDCVRLSAEKSARRHIYHGKGRPGAGRRDHVNVEVEGHVESQHGACEDHYIDEYLQRPGAAKIAKVSSMWTTSVIKLARQPQGRKLERWRSVQQEHKEMDDCSRVLGVD